MVIEPFAMVYSKSSACNLPITSGAAMTQHTVTHRATDLIGLLEQFFGFLARKRTKRREESTDANGNIVEHRNIEQRGRTWDGEDALSPALSHQMGEGEYYGGCGVVAASLP